MLVLVLAAQDRLEEEITAYKAVEDAAVAAADARTQQPLPDAQMDPMVKALIAYLQEARQDCFHVKPCIPGRATHGGIMAVIWGIARFAVLLQGISLSGGGTR